MNRKEFFKVTKNKIIVTGVIITLFVINILTGIFGGPHFNFFVILPLVIFTIPVFYVNNVIAFFIIIASFIVEVLYLYTISCFTTSIYNKYLRRLRNK